MKIIVPNLDRRPDRWYVCLGALIGLDYNPELIQRFSAHDGDDYDSFDAARKAALEQFPHSTYLRTTRLGTHYYCWCWTWYEIMTEIIRGEHGDLVCCLVDDYSPNYFRKEMENNLRVLHSISPIKCVQLACNSQTPPAYSKDDILPPGPPVGGGIPFTYKIHASGDFINIVSPLGAREILAVADSHDNLGVPNCVFWQVARDLSDFNGYYAAYGGHDRPLANRHVNSFQDGRYHC